MINQREGPQPQNIASEHHSPPYEDNRRTGSDQRTRGGRNIRDWLLRNAHSDSKQTRRNEQRGERCTRLGRPSSGQQSASPHAHDDADAWGQCGRHQSGTIKPSVGDHVYVPINPQTLPEARQMSKNIVTILSG